MKSADSPASSPHTTHWLALLSVMAETVASAYGARGGPVVLRAFGRRPETAQRDDVSVPDDAGVEHRHLPKWAQGDLFDVTTETVVLAGSAIMEFFHPGSSLLLSPAAPSLALRVKRSLRHFAQVRRHVEHSGHDFDELVARCDGVEEKEQLLVRLLDATRVAGAERQLRMLAGSLSMPRHRTSP